MNMIWSFILFAGWVRHISLFRRSSGSTRGNALGLVRLEDGVSCTEDEAVVLEEHESIEYRSFPVGKHVVGLSCMDIGTELESKVNTGSTTVVGHAPVEKDISSSSLSLHPRPRVRAVPLRRCAGDTLRVEALSPNMVLGDWRANVDRGEMTRSFKAMAERGLSRSTGR
jgi:hypothetical protein